MILGFRRRNACWTPQTVAAVQTRYAYGMGMSPYRAGLARTLTVNKAAAARAVGINRSKLLHLDVR